MDAILSGIEAIFEFLNSGLYAFVTETLKYLIGWVVIFWIQIKIFSLSFFWGVAGVVIDNMGITSVIDSAWDSLPPDLVKFLTRYKIPQALDLVIHAALTKFILGMFKL